MTSGLLPAAVIAVVLNLVIPEEKYFNFKKCITFTGDAK